MREKLLDLMKNEGLKPGQLAELLGVNPAGISHILAGRNKPGFDLLQKILRRFPQIDPDWLLLDGETMYRSGHGPGNGAGSDTSSLRVAGPRAGYSARSTNGATPYGGGLFDPQPTGEWTVGMDSRQTQPTGTSATPNGTDTTTERLAMPGTGKAIARIVVFYADGTFEHYAPTMR